MMSLIVFGLSWFGNCMCGCFGITVTFVRIRFRKSFFLRTERKGWVRVWYTCWRGKKIRFLPCDIYNNVSMFFFLNVHCQSYHRTIWSLLTSLALPPSTVISNDWVDDWPEFPLPWSSWFAIHCWYFLVVQHFFRILLSERKTVGHKVDTVDCCSWFFKKLVCLLLLIVFRDFFCLSRCEGSFKDDVDEDSYGESSETRF